MSIKKNPNLGDILFSRKNFASTEITSSSTGPCRKNCMTCPRMNLSGKLILEGKQYTLQKGSCKTEDIIYVCVCNSCEDFYIGQTLIPFNKRMNNHRTCFKNNAQKSALSKHIELDHPDLMVNTTENFNIGILAKTSPLRLDRLENKFVRDTKADLIHLNRYKPSNSS